MKIIILDLLVFSHIFSHPATLLKEILICLLCPLAVINSITMHCCFLDPVVLICTIHSLEQLTAVDSRMSKDIRVWPAFPVCLAVFSVLELKTDQLLLGSFW
jgi:hypothetical protein